MKIYILLKFFAYVLRLELIKRIIVLQASTEITLKYLLPQQQLQNSDGSNLICTIKWLIFSTVRV